MDINELIFNEELCMYHLDSVLELGYIRQDILNEKMEFNLKSIINRIIEFVRETFKRISEIFNKFKRYILSKINKKNNKDNSVDDSDKKLDKYDIIEKAIANKDIKTLRMAIANLCYTSRDFSSGEFDAYIKYVESKGFKLREKFNEDPPLVSSQKSEFTDDDFADAVFELKHNFCDERIQDVKIIGKALYGKGSTNANIKKPKMTRAEAIKKIFGKDNIDIDSKAFVKYLESHNKIKLDIELEYYPNNILVSPNLFNEEIAKSTPIRATTNYEICYVNLSSNTSHTISDTELYNNDVITKLKQDSFKFLVQKQHDFDSIYKEYGDINAKNLVHFMNGNPKPLNNVSINVLDIYYVAKTIECMNMKPKALLSNDFINTILDDILIMGEGTIKHLENIKKKWQNNNIEVPKKDMEVLTSLVATLCEVYSALSKSIIQSLTMMLNRYRKILNEIIEFYIKEEIENS